MFNISFSNKSNNPDDENCVICQDNLPSLNLILTHQVSNEVAHKVHFICSKKREINAEVEAKDCVICKDKVIKLTMDPKLDPLKNNQYNFFYYYLLDCTKILDVEEFKKTFDEFIIYFPEHKFECLLKFLDLLNNYEYNENEAIAHEEIIAAKSFLAVLENYLENEQPYKTALKILLVALAILGGAGLFLLYTFPSNTHSNQSFTSDTSIAHSATQQTFSPSMNVVPILPNLKESITLTNKLNKLENWRYETLGLPKEALYKLDFPEQKKLLANPSTFKRIMEIIPWKHLRYFDSEHLDFLLDHNAELALIHSNDPNLFNLYLEEEVDIFISFLLFEIEK